MSRARIIIVKQILDKLRNQKLKTNPKVFDIESNLVRRRRVHPTIDARHKKLILLQDVILLPEPFNIGFR